MISRYINCSEEFDVTRDEMSANGKGVQSAEVEALAVTC